MMMTRMTFIPRSALLRIHHGVCDDYCDTTNSQDELAPPPLSSSLSPMHIMSLSIMP